jgi:hypothetical protein
MKFGASSSMSFDHTPVSFEITILKEYFAQFFPPS